MWTPSLESPFRLCVMLFWILCCSLLLLSSSPVAHYLWIQAVFYSCTFPDVRHDTQRPSGRGGTKAIEIGKPGCWPAILSEKDLDQKGENHEGERAAPGRKSGGAVEALSHLCRGESPMGRTLPFQRSSVVLTALSSLFPSIKYFLLLCTRGSSCRLYQAAVPFFSWINSFGDEIPSRILFHGEHHLLRSPALTPQ